MFHVDSDAGFVTLERAMFVSALALRKLLGAAKLSDEMEAATFSVVAYPRLRRGAIHDTLNVHRVDEFYDLGAPTNRDVTAKFLSDQLLHSFVFMPVLDDRARYVRSVLFNSDRSKDKSVFEIAIATVAELVESICRDEIMSIHRNRVTGHVRKSQGELPDFPPHRSPPA